MPARSERVPGSVGLADGDDGGAGPAHRTSLGSREVVPLETADATLARAAGGRTWSGDIYVATPQLLRAYGISAARISPGADFLTVRTGLSSTTKMRLMYGAVKFGPIDPSTPCLPSDCVANPKIEEIGALPCGTSAPNTVITEQPSAGCT